MGLIAVLPARQRSGIGSRLIEAGLKECKKSRYGLVVVLGHPAYYPRFGFTRAGRYGISWEGNAPEEAFMVRELKKENCRKSAGS